MASTSTASVLQTVVPYTITIKGATPLSSWRSLMLITNSSGQTSAVWDQHQTLKSMLLPLPPRLLPPPPRPSATAGFLFFEFTDIAFPLLVGILNISGVSRLFSTSIWRQARHAVAFYRHSHLTAAVRWLCVERARAACAGHSSSAPATRSACIVNSLASSEFWQKFDAQRRTGHIFHFSMRGPCVALVWLGL